MTHEEKLQAIKQVMKSIESDSQDLENGLEEMAFIIDDPNSQTDPIFQLRRYTDWLIGNKIVTKNTNDKTEDLIKSYLHFFSLSDQLRK